MHGVDIQPDRQFCTVMPDDRKSAFDVREPSVAASDYAGAGKYPGTRGFIEVIPLMTISYLTSMTFS